MTHKKTTEDFVIKDGVLIGQFEKLYKVVDDPWNQSREDHVFDSRRQIALNFCLRARTLFESNRILEVGCGFGYLTAQLYKAGFKTLGSDISQTAIKKAKKMHPKCNFLVSDYDNFSLINEFNPDIVLMPEITWYVLDTLDNFLVNLKYYANSRHKPTFLIHLLSTYAPGIQKLGNKKFTNDNEIKEYFNLDYIESGYVEVARPGDSLSRGTYFIAKIS